MPIALGGLALLQCDVVIQEGDLEIRPLGGASCRRPLTNRSGGRIDLLGGAIGGFGGRGG